MKHLFTACLLITAFSVSAQRILPQSWFNENNISDEAISVGDQSRLFGISALKDDSKLDYYWDKDFKVSKVYFYSQKVNSGSVISDSVSGIETRIDLWNKRVEFNTANEIKVAEALKVSNIFAINSEKKLFQFINAKEFGSENLTSFFKLLNASENNALLMSKEVIVQNANYNAALDTGNKEATIAKMDHFYYWNGTSLIGIDSKKEVSELLTDLGFNAKDYLKKSCNKLKSEEDYLKLGHYIFANR